MKKSIIIFFVLLVLVGAALGYWYYRERVFSKEVLKLEILGKEKVKVGEEIEYTLKYKNNGNFTLEDITLIFELPENSLVEDNRIRITKNLEDIYPGQERVMQFKARIFGKENDLKEARAWLSYRPKNLKANFESETTFTTEIEFVPLTLEFDLPSRLEKEKEVQFSLNYFSNLDYTLSNLGIRVEYPESFQFISAEPEPLEKTEWEIPVLEKAGGGRIKVRGEVKGEPGQKQKFQAQLGIWQDGEFIVLRETTKEIEIIEPLLYISQQINGVSDYIASPGEELHYEIFFRNIGQTPFENQFLITRLSGEAIDLSSLKSDLGQVNPNDNLVVWDWKQVPELRFLDVKEEGKVEFTLELKENWQVLEDNKGETTIKNEVNLSQMTQEFETKVNSKLEVVQKGYFESEIFENSGPIPPKAEEETTYTIVWEAKNYYNKTENVKIRATLPENVELTGKILPEEEVDKFSFDPESREVVWVVTENTMRAGEGVLNDPPRVTFQVKLTPTETQRGFSATVIGKVQIKGEDKWTEMRIEAIDEPIDTTLPDDSSISVSEGRVR